MQSVLQDLQGLISLYDWLRQTDGMEKEAEHVKGEISKICLQFDVTVKRNP